MNTNIYSTIFSFIQLYNLHPNNENNDSTTNHSLDPFNTFSDEEQSSQDQHYSIPEFNKTPDIPSTTDFQTGPFNPYSQYPYQQNKQKSNNTNSKNQSDIHDYDIYNNPRRHTYDRYNFRSQPRTDYRLFLGGKDIISVSQKSS